MFFFFFFNEKISFSSFIWVIYSSGIVKNNQGRVNLNELHINAFCSVLWLTRTFIILMMPGYQIVQFVPFFSALIVFLRLQQFQTSGSSAAAATAMMAATAELWPAIKYTWVCPSV